MTEYMKKISEVTDDKPITSDIYNKYTYDRLRNIVFDIAEILKNRHPYAYFFLVGKLNSIVLTPVYADELDAEEDQLKKLKDVLLQQLSDCFEELRGLVKLQEIFREAVRFCVDMDNLPLRSAAERLVGFFYKYPAFESFVIQSGFIITPTKKGKLDFEKVEEINDQNITGTKELLSKIHEGQQGVSILGCYIIENLEEMLFFEFTEMLKKGLVAKKCKLCGRYFVVKNRRRDYCDRIYKDGKTCKEAGSKITYKKTVGEDAALREYNTIYNRMASRCFRAEGKLDSEYSGKDITKEQFEAWSKKAQKARQDYVSGKITAGQMLSIIDVD